jgi:hypothetical protein
MENHLLPVKLFAFTGSAECSGAAPIRGAAWAWRQCEIRRVYGQESMPVYAGTSGVPEKFSEAEKPCLLDSPFHSAGRLSP